VIYLTTDGTGPGTSANAAEASDHWRTRHWMPWLLPLLAIALPVLAFVVVASIPVFAMRWGEAATSLGRGDFLIPVLILCLEACRRWGFEVSWEDKKRAAKWCSMAACGFAGCVCLLAFMYASSLPVTPVSHQVTPAGAKSMTAVTLVSFTVGLILGTIAVAVSVPDAEGT
jgi:cobalamin synthase